MGCCMNIMHAYFSPITNYHLFILNQDQEVCVETKLCHKEGGHDGSGVAHLSPLHCESKIWHSDLVFD